MADHNGGIAVVYILIGIPLKAIAFIKILDIKLWKFMISNYRTFKKDIEVEYYMLILLDLINNLGQNKLI